MEFSPKNVSIFADFGVKINSRAYTLIRDPRVVISHNNLLNISLLFQSSVDRMMQRGNASLMVGAASWKDQFVDAFTVQAGK